MKAKRLAASGPVEGPWALPDGWQWSALGSLGRWTGGGTPSKANPGYWTNGTIPWVSPKDMKRLLIDSSENAITVGAVAGSSAKLVPADSLLCVMRSGILRHTFPVAVNTVEVTLNQDMRALTPAEGINPRLLAYYLQLTGQTVLLNAAKAGTTVNSVEASRLDQHPVPLPLDPTAQDRLADRIDELFAEIDEGEAALARAREDLATWRKALLKAAVTGELTADWRPQQANGESAEHILQRIDAVRAARGQKPSQRPASFSVHQRNDFPELPAGWAWTTVEKLGSVVTGGTPPTAEPGNYDGEIPFFTPGDLDQGEHLQSTRRTISQKGLAAVRAIPAQSVLVTCIGATIGKVGLNASAGATNQQINSIVPDISGLAEYLFYYFDGPGRHDVVEASSSTTMPILNKGDFSRLLVPLPPMSEVVEIVRRIQADRRAGIDMLRTLSAQAESSRTLRQSILSAAFRGELTA